MSHAMKGCKMKVAGKMNRLLALLVVLVCYSNGRVAKAELDIVCSLSPRCAPEH